MVITPSSTSLIEAIGLSFKAFSITLLTIKRGNRFQEAYFLMLLSSNFSFKGEHIRCALFVKLVIQEIL